MDNKNPLKRTKVKPTPRPSNAYDYAFEPQGGSDKSEFYLFLALIFAASLVVLIGCSFVIHVTQCECASLKVIL